MSAPVVASSPVWPASERTRCSSLSSARAPPPSAARTDTAASAAAMRCCAAASVAAPRSAAGAVGKAARTPRPHMKAVAGWSPEAARRRAVASANTARSARVLRAANSVTSGPRALARCSMDVRASCRSAPLHGSNSDSSACCRPAGAAWPGPVLSELPAPLAPCVSGVSTMQRDVADASRPSTA
jgi:hypothetical protein